MTRQPKKSPNFFLELKRRKVYKVAIGYIALAYLALQIVDLLIPATRLPEWADAFFVGLAIVGFPIALILGWAFEVSSTGVHWTHAEDAEELDDSKAIVRWSPIVAIILFVIFSFVAWVSFTKSTPTMVDDSNRAVAVLPFETLGSDQANAFTEGIHAGVLTRLSNVADLDIISRTSVRAYQDTTKPLPEIAVELGAAWVVLAEVQEVGNNVLVNARLIRAADDRQVWAEEYRRTITAETIFEIQSDLSLSIISALETRISPHEELRIEQLPTNSLDAYRYALLGRQESDKRTAESMRRSAELFGRAIDIDRNYAMAWTGLAEALAIAYDYGFDDDDDLLVQAEEAIRRALEIDPQSGDAHAVMGVVHYARQEGQNSILALNRAVSLQPNNANAHSWLSWINALIGNASAAIESGKRAVMIDPLGAEAVSNLALSYLSKGQYEQGLMESRHALQLLPNWSTARLYEGTALYHLGRYAEAQRVLSELTVEWAFRGADSALAITLLALGNRAGAENILETLEKSDDPFSAGLVHAALGDYDAANQWWLRVEHWNAWATIAIRDLYPEVLGPFRKDPRYVDIIARVDREWGISSR